MSDDVWPSSDDEDQKEMSALIEKKEQIKKDLDALSVQKRALLQQYWEVENEIVALAQLMRLSR